ncbi:MAG: cell division protein FtsZ, partial [Actinomycetaceae bacterium]|nr:cell division protein FtsZ [Actinomycetaceae bacterium]
VIAAGFDDQEPASYEAPVREKEESAPSFEAPSREVPSREYPSESTQRPLGSLPQSQPAHRAEPKIPTRQSTFPSAPAAKEEPEQKKAEKFVVPRIFDEDDDSLDLPDFLR